MGIARKRNNGVNRIVWAILAFIIQIVWLVWLFLFVRQYMPVIEAVVRIAALLLALYIFYTERTSAISTPWVFFILLLPFMGTILWLLFARSGVTKNMRRQHDYYGKIIMKELADDAGAAEALEKEDPIAVHQVKYASTAQGNPLYFNRYTQFFNNTTDAFESQLQALKTAEKFIFLEYHAVEDAQAFGLMKQILFEKAAQGVEVRMLIDDVGSIAFIGKSFARQMEEHGIKFLSFNRLMPALRGFMNHRDHRKITVVDGKIGFTGGYNLADEYFNINSPYGFWRDTGVRIEGPAVKSLTALFLHMWNASLPTDYDFGKYLINYDEWVAGAHETDGYVVVYQDNPLNNVDIAEDIYLNLLKGARERVWITTPYLIISNEMKRELCLAARRGIDVRIVTPGIPDKKFIYAATRSYYPDLLQAGVKIYEFTPGFCHSKQWIADETLAVVGTINMDFRSLRLHFEDGVLLYKCQAIEDIANDFSSLFEQCTQIEYQPRPVPLELGQVLIRLIAPLI